ncbi:MAG: aldolase catalytic domain-containing protein [Clostridia bacterium]|nr:aldolase catalytic domain-containing protein [Clostridia bacterium]
MQRIHLLDCTLRDGGYVNNWEFGAEAIENITGALIDGGIDIIELGFVSQTKQIKEGCSINRNTDLVKVNKDKNNAKFAVMINYGEFNAADLAPKKLSQVDIIRVAFHKKDYKAAMDFCNECYKKGYEMFLQPMNALAYTDEEFTDLINIANKSHVSAFYIVDTFGNMSKGDVKRFCKLVNDNLDRDFIVGFHSHNNLQLSFSNSQEFIRLNTERNVIIDSSMYGMGRGAGNLCTELMINYLNSDFGANYKLLPVINGIDQNIIPIFNKISWGYSIPYYIASINDCHPSYATELVFKQTLSINDINSIITHIPENKRASFDKELIEKLYREYQDNHVDDSAALAELKKVFCGKNVLVLAPGKTLTAEKDKIERFINMTECIVVTINFTSEEFPADYTFISNVKRLKNVKDCNNVIHTSNVKLKEGYCLNYSDRLIEDKEIADNAGLMAIKLFSECGAGKIYLAGFDGYTFDGKDNYFDIRYTPNKSVEHMELSNRKIKKAIADFISGGMDIEFITASIYAE